MPELSDPRSERRVIYRGRKIDLALQPVALADGSIAEREVVVHRGAVALVPMVDADHVCLVKNDRYAVGKTLLEVPAGHDRPGRVPRPDRRARARRGDRLPRGPDHPVRDWFVSPGVMTERMFLYLCEDLEPGPDRPPARRAARARDRPLGRGRRHGPRRPDRGRQVDAGPA